MIINLNGRFITSDQEGPSFTDGAFLFGDTLFETLKARQGRVLFLNEHLDRVEYSAQLIDFPFNRPLAARALQESAHRVEPPCARLRLTLSRGNFSSLDWPSAKSAYFVITAAPYEEPPTDARDRGAHCIFAPNQRVNPLSHRPQLKRGNYADCLYAAGYARLQGATEALFLSNDGFLLEGAVSNLFLLIDGCLHTPAPGNLVLAGIMRQQVILAAHTLGITVVQRNILKEEIFTADEIFLTNSLIDLMPVLSVENRKISTSDTWKRLLAQIRIQELAATCK